MSATEPTETELTWLTKIVDDMIVESKNRLAIYEYELTRFPNGPVRIALHPRLVAERIFCDRLATLRGGK